MVLLHTGHPIFFLFLNRIYFTPYVEVLRTVVGSLAHDTIFAAQLYIVSLVNGTPLQSVKNRPWW